MFEVRDALKERYKKQHAGEANPGVYRKRLMACEACPLRSLNRCGAVNGIITDLARHAKNPVHADCQWDGVKPLRRAKPYIDTNPHEPTLEEERRLDAIPKHTLALVTCFFNPAGYRRLRENYSRFHESLGPLAEHLTTIELAFDSDPFTIEGDRVIHVRGTRERNMLWQKERLLNLAAQSVPENYTSISYLDCDLLFDNHNWYRDTLLALERYPAVQLFSTIDWLEPCGHPGERPRGTSFAAYRKPGFVRPEKSVYPSPGGGWAYHRHLWPIQDFHILGGGDSMFLWSKLGRLDHQKLDTLSDPWFTLWASQTADVFRKVRGNLGCTPGNVRHLYHGSRELRKYNSRWDRLRNFDPARDIETDPETGIWRWTDQALAEKAEMVSSVADYFKERREDD